MPRPLPLAWRCHSQPGAPRPGRRSQPAEDRPPTPAPLLLTPPARPAHARRGSVGVVAELLGDPGDAAAHAEPPDGAVDCLGHRFGGRRVRWLQPGGEQRKAPSVADVQPGHGELCSSGHLTPSLFRRRRVLGFWIRMRFTVISSASRHVRARLTSRPVILFGTGSASDGMSRRRHGASPEGAHAVESSAAGPGARQCGRQVPGHDSAAGDRAAGAGLGSRPARRPWSWYWPPSMPPSTCCARCGPARPGSWSSPPRRRT